MGCKDASEGKWPVIHCLCIASFPGLAQLSIAISTCMESRRGPGIFSHMHE